MPGFGTRRTIAGVPMSHMIRPEPARARMVTLQSDGESDAKPVCSA